MHLLTLPLSSNSHVYVEGDVSIDPSAAIAPGVILRAAPGSKIIIGTGVCIGLGSVLHAHEGTLEVEAGAKLGAGVLLVGKGKIGANACIGAVTTIWNASIEPWQVLPAASVVGDQGRQLAAVPVASTSPPSPQEVDTSDSTLSEPKKEALNGQVASNQAVASTSTTDEVSQTESAVKSANSEADTSVSGQGSLERILKTLFPYDNQSLNPSSEDG